MVILLLVLIASVRGFVRYIEILLVQLRNCVEEKRDGTVTNERDNHEKGKETYINLCDGKNRTVGNLHVILICDRVCSVHHFV